MAQAPEQGQIETPTIPLAQVVWDENERFRSDLGDADLDELVESIKAGGLIQPIVLGRDNRLIAGRRRLEAHRRLGLDRIKFVYFDALDEISRRVAELDENIKRKALSWQEEALAIAEIYRLRRSADPKWGLADTAREIGVSEAKVSQDYKLAGHVEAGTKAVLSHPTRSGALVAARKVREIELTQELARRRAAQLGLPEAEQTGPPRTQLPHGLIINDDCLNVLKELGEGSIDLIVTDPPWGIEYERASQQVKKWVPSYADGVAAVSGIMNSVIPAMRRVLKETSHFYCFYAIQNFEFLLLCETHGFAMRRRPLIWYKAGQQSVADPFLAFQGAYEAIAWGWKPDGLEARRLFCAATPDAFSCPRVIAPIHDTEKPSALIQRLVEASSLPNEVVLDPFCGSGATLEAAFAAGRSYIGVELDPLNYTNCVERMKKLEGVEDDEEEVEESDDASLS